MGDATGQDMLLTEHLEEQTQRVRAQREVLGALGVEGRIALLAQVAQRWMDPSDPFRVQAIRALPGECFLAEEQVAWGLDQAFAGVDAATLRAWWDREGGSGSASLSAHLWSGNVFVAGLPPVVASLLAGVPAFIKAPSRQPTFASLLVDSVAAVAADLGASLGQAAWPRSDAGATDRLMSAADVVFAFGADESIAALQVLAPPDLRFCGFGHRYSIAVVLGDTADQVADGRSLESSFGSLEGLARDLLVWDGQGCLTPRWIFVEGDLGRAQSLAAGAAEFLPELVTRFPGQRLGPQEGAVRSSWLASAAFAGWSRAGDHWAVAAVPWSEALPPAPPPRCLCFAAIPDLALLPSILAPLGRRLQGVARLGTVARDQELAELCAPLGLSRLAKAGALQQPPVDWNHDDVRILASLCAG
ncbi:MAG: hypothetical protein CL928_13900 [Deltaproteobacteria bacterium]|nr:hypothetical protein [Deltaproteobacteria bacterium]